MDVLYLLIPMSAALVLLILGVFGWAVHRGQFDDVEHEGQRILLLDVNEVDTDQRSDRRALEQSANGRPTAV